MYTVKLFKCLCYNIMFILYSVISYLFFPQTTTVLCKKTFYCMDAYTSQRTGSVSTVMYFGEQR